MKYSRLYQHKTYFPGEKTELARYLAGYPDHAIVNRYAYTPTDPISAISPILKHLKENPPFLETLHRAMVILTLDQAYCWMVMYPPSGSARKQKSTGFLLISAELLTNLKQGILANKSYLSGNQLWVGAGHQLGLRGDVMRMSQNIQEIHGVAVFSDIIGESKPRVLDGPFGNSINGYLAGRKCLMDA